MTRNSLSFKLTSQDCLRVRGVLNIFKFWVRFIGHPHTLSPYLRLRSFTLRAHTTIFQITRLYVSSIFPLQVKFTRDRSIGRHSYGLTSLSHIVIWKYRLNLNNLMVCKIFQLHRLTSLSFCCLAAHLLTTSPDLKEDLAWSWRQSTRLLFTNRRNNFPASTSSGISSQQTHTHTHSHYWRQWVA